MEGILTSIIFKWLMVLRHYRILALYFIIALTSVSSCFGGLYDTEADNYPTLECPNNIDSLCIKVRKDGWGYYSLELITSDQIILKDPANWEGELEYRDDVMKDIIDYVHKDKRWVYDYTGPNLVDCGIQGEVLFYADTTLFGLPAGENLIDYCEVEGGFLQCSYPDYQVIEYIGRSTPMREFFSRGTALPNMNPIGFHFSSIPMVVPRSFSLTLEIPIEITDWDSFAWTKRTDKFVHNEKERLGVSPD